MDKFIYGMDLYLKLLKKLLVLFLLFTIISCSKNNSQQKIKTDDRHPLLSYQVVDSLKFEVPTDLSPSFIMTKTGKIDDSRIYIGLTDNILQVFDLSNRRLAKRIEIPKEGPFYRGEVKDFYFVNYDSIFLLYPRQAILQLMNSEGDIANEWNLLVNNPYEDEILGIESYGAARNADNLIFNQETNSVFIRVYPQEPFYTSSEPYNYKNKIEYSLETKKIVSYFGIFPEGLKDKNKFQTNDHIFGFKLHNFKDSLYYIFTFNRDHNIYNVDVKDNSTSILGAAKSKYMPIDYPLVDRGADLFTVLTDSYVQKPRYDYSFFDENGQFYRVVKHESSTSLGQTPFSILKFNESFQVVGEVVFPKGIYSLLEIKPFKKDILLVKLLSKSDDEIEFHLIEIKDENK